MANIISIYMNDKYWLTEYMFTLYLIQVNRSNGLIDKGFAACYFEP